jgi:hypothetical protein
MAFAAQRIRDSQPCHSPTARGWFIGRATGLAGPGAARLVVAHENIPERKQAEAAPRESQERDIARRKEAEAALVQTKERLDGLPLRLTELREHEPRLIARKLHDQIRAGWNGLERGIRPRRLARNYGQDYMLDNESMAC